MLSKSDEPVSTRGSILVRIAFLSFLASSVSQIVTYLFCDRLEYRFKELISRVRQATKDVVKSEV